MRSGRGPGAGAPGEAPGLPAGQVVLLRRARHLVAREGRLDEQPVGAPREVDDRGGVALMVDDVGHVDDLLAGHDAQGRGAQLAERHGPLAYAGSVAPAHGDRGGVRLAARHRRLEVAQPGADRQAEALEAALPDIDVELLLEREGEAGDLVVEDRGADAEGLLVEQPAAGARRNPARLGKSAVTPASTPPSLPTSVARTVSSLS